MELEFILAIIMAGLVFILKLMFGEEIGAWLKTTSAAIVVVPILLICIFGALDMSSADPETASAIAGSTIEKVVSYAGGKFPGIVIADFAGAIAGAIGGFIVGVVKGCH